MGTSKNAQAASYIHLVYNVLGAVIFCVLAVVYFAFINPVLAASSITATNISMVHTGYNVAALVLLFPLGQLILKISAKMAGIGKPGASDDASELPELDESILETPSYALENSSNAILKLMELMRADLTLGVELFIERDYRKIADFWAKANQIDRANSKINGFLTMLYNEEMSKSENMLAASLLHVTISLKRISNRTKGFAKLTQDMRDSGIKKRYAGGEKLKQIYKETMICYDNMIDAFRSNDEEAINQTMQKAESIDLMREEFKTEHLARASSNSYTVEMGLMYAEAARHLSRIAHSIKSIMETITQSDDEEEMIKEVFDRR